MLEQIEFTSKNILEHTKQFRPQIGIILGTGLGGLVKEISVEFVLPYNEIPHFPVSTVEGHSGKLIFGELAGKKVMVMQGRFHYYEGYSMEQIAFPVRVMKNLGVRTLLVSNACGGMNPVYQVGDLMIIRDHINLFPGNPLIGKNHDVLGPRFPDMSEAYDPNLMAKARSIAKTQGIALQEGVYVGLSGPCFETPAEYRFLRIIGADVVGMSTVPEVIAAKHCGMAVFGLSIVTDLGIEGRVQKVTHEEVQLVAAMQEPKMTLLLKELTRQL